MHLHTCIYMYNTCIIYMYNIHYVMHILCTLTLSLYSDSTFSDLQTSNKIYWKSREGVRKGSHLVKESEDITISLFSPVSECTAMDPQLFTTATSLPRGHTDLLFPAAELMAFRKGFPLPNTTGRQSMLQHTQRSVRSKFVQAEKPHLPNTIVVLYGFSLLRCAFLISWSVYVRCIVA